MKLDRDKYTVEEETRALLRATRKRIRAWHGGTGRETAPQGRLHKNARRDFALLSAVAITGVRVSEIAGLRHGDMVNLTLKDGDHARLRVRRAKKKDRNTGGPVFEDVILPHTARVAMIDYVAKIPPSEKEPHCRVFPITTRAIERLFKYYAKRAELNPRLSIHALRHGYAVELYRQHRDLELVRRALGHENINTTQIYMHVVDGEKKLASMSMDLGGDLDDPA